MRGSKYIHSGKIGKVPFRPFCLTEDCDKKKIDFYYKSREICHNMKVVGGLGRVCGTEVGTVGNNFFWCRRNEIERERVVDRRRKEKNPSGVELGNEHSWKRKDKSKSDLWDDDPILSRVGQTVVLCHGWWLEKHEFWWKGERIYCHLLVA